MRRIPQFIASLFRGRRRPDIPGLAPQPNAARPSPSAVAASLDRAIRMRLWRVAALMARSAEPLCREAPEVCARVARLRLLERDPRGAIALIDRCRRRTHELRVLRLAALIAADRRADAHRELLGWTCSAHAPRIARRLLAALDAQHGHLYEATEGLLRNLVDGDDVPSLEHLVVLSTLAGRHDAAERFSARLDAARVRQRTALDPTIFQSALRLPENTALEPTAPDVVELSAQLIAAEAVVPALVESLRLRPNRRAARLLAAAIEHGLGDMAHSGKGYEALATLALIDNDRITARDWATRGLARYPHSANLSAVQREVDFKLTPDPASPRPPDSGVIGRIGGPDQEQAA